MRTLAAAAIASALWFSAGSAQADEELFRRSNCLACHHVEQRRLGPSLKDIAARYAGDATAVDHLAGRIRAGGGGVWGQLPMPPQPQVSEENGRKLAEFILSLR